MPRDTFSQAVNAHASRLADQMLDQLRREANDRHFIREYNLQVRRWDIDSAHSRECDGYGCDGY